MVLSPSVSTRRTFHREQRDELDRCTHAEQRALVLVACSTGTLVREHATHAAGAHAARGCHERGECEPRSFFIWGSFLKHCDRDTGRLGNDARRLAEYPGGVKRGPLGQP